MVGTVALAALIVTTGFSVSTQKQTKADVSGATAVGSLAWAGDRSEHLLQVLEKRASTSSFADLDAFGEKARARRDIEGARRLQHVVTIYLKQGEYQTAARWNADLKAKAYDLNSARYITVSRLNEDMLAYKAGDLENAIQIRQVMDQTDDWFVRAVATRYYASTRFDFQLIGEGLKLLSAVQAQIPDNQPESSAASAGIWEMMGVGLMDLHDVRGATDAFTRFELDYGHEGWPRPDFDSLYNLGDMAIQIGDVDNAERYFAVHDRLTKAANIQGLSVYNAIMCAKVANLADDMSRVLDCLSDHERLLKDETFFQVRVWPLMAVAFARQGRVAEAERLLARWQALHDATPVDLENLGVRARAEIAFAKGDSRTGMALMRLYVSREVASKARAYGEGVNQVTQDIQLQLTQRRHQLAVEQANVRLQAGMIRAQAWIVGVTLFFLFIGGVFVIWLWVQSRELRRARSRAEEASTAKTRFLANMSHEIRTPLNGVMAMADALARRDLAPKDSELVDVIRSSATTLERLLSDILDSARIESGEMGLESAPFNLHAMLKDVVGLWAVRAETKAVNIRLHCTEDTDRMVMGDAVRLRQVLNNLVSNALKFTESGSVTVEAIAAAGDRIYFCVTDTGCGFDDTVRQRLFARFQQADESITRRYGGSGLGLNISQELIALMGGAMDCSSIPGHGAKFWFEVALPRVEDERGEVAEKRDLMAEHSMETSTGLGLRVLLADDNAANRKVVEVLLAALDVELVSVSDGGQAVMAFVSDHFDLVLMDMQMPIMDGLTATRRLREIEKRDGRTHTPLIMLTANAMAEHVEASLAAGADAHLTKPLTAQSLMDSINSVLDVAG